METESREFEPEESGTAELELEEGTIDDENGGDDIASTWKPLTANQKSVIQNIHNNCGHPSREEFLRAPSQPRTTRSPQLRAARVRVSSMCSQGTSSEAKDACSITTDLPFQRDARCGPF